MDATVVGDASQVKAESETPGVVPRFRLDSVSMRGFRLVEDSTVNLGGSGLVYLGGENKDVPGASSNMAGKTTLVSAIVWAITGLNLNGKVAAADVMRYGSSSSAFVTLRFTGMTSPAGIVVVRRMRSKTKTIVEVDFEDSNFADFKGTPDMVEPRLTELFGPLEMFIPAHVFTVEEGTRPFALETDAQKKGLFDLIVRSNDLEEARERATESVRVLTQEITDGDIQVARLEGEIAQLQDMAEHTQESLRIQLQGHESILTLEGDNKRVAVDSERNWITRIADLRGMMPDTYQMEREYEVAGTKAVAAHRDAYALEERVVLQPGEECQVCGQVATSAHVEKAQASRNIEIGKAQRAAKDAEAHHVDLHKKLKTCKEEYDQALVGVRNTEDQKRAACVEIARADGEIRIALAGKKEVINQTRRLRVQETKVKDKTNDINRVKGERLQKERLVETYKFWREAFGAKGIKAFRLEQIIPTLNASASKYAGQLFGDGMTVAYATQKQNKDGSYREEFTLSVYDATGRVIDSVSAGQAMRRDIIHTLAMSELAAQLGFRRVDMLMMDEVFRSLDAAGIDGVMNILRRLEETVDTILVIEHSEEMESRFDKVLQAVRENGRTTYR